MNINYLKLLKNISWNLCLSFQLYNNKQYPKYLSIDIKKSVYQQVLEFFKNL